MGTILVTKMYINNHDSRINPGNRSKDICRDTSATVSHLGKVLNALFSTV